MKNEQRKGDFHLMRTFLRPSFVVLFLVMATIAFSQNKSISGTILDSAGEPIIGANVSVDGTVNGTISDVDGKFSLSSVPDNSKLKVSYIGFITQILPVSGKTDFKIILKEDAQSLDEVVVVGYGSVKKSALTSAVWIQKVLKTVSWLVLSLLCKDN